jgi:hypothetical protein
MDFAEHFNRAYHAGLDAGRRVVRKVRRAEGWELAAYLVVGLFLVALLLPAAVALAVAALVVALAVAWVHEFVFLMRLGPDAFPGRHDRAVWIALMLLLPPVGLLAFWTFRRAAWPESKSEAGRSDEWL